MKGERIFVTGGAGFIGSNLVDVLMEGGAIVTVYDNFSTGRKDFICEHLKKNNFKLVKGDLLDFEKLRKAMMSQKFVFHFAANSDIRKGTEKTDTDLRENIIATYNVLEAMRLANVKKIVFPSTCTVYGEIANISIPETYGPMLPISLYGASKLACESLISACCHMFDFQAWIFRFANIVGPRTTHGVVLDFVNKLRKETKELEILGDGKQKKSYMIVNECVDAMLFAVAHAHDKVNIFNLATEDDIEVRRIAEIVVEEMNLKEVSFRYTGTSRGWKGDIPRIKLSTESIKRLGWKSKCTSEEAVRIAARSLL